MSSETKIGGAMPPNTSISPSGIAGPTRDIMVTPSVTTPMLYKHCNTSGVSQQFLGVSGKGKMTIRKIKLLAPVRGVAPQETYDPTIDLLFDDEDVDTVKLAAILSITAKLPVVEVERGK